MNAADWANTVLIAFAAIGSGIACGMLVAGIWLLWQSRQRRTKS